MKKVVRGRVYDTEKAIFIAEFFDEKKPGDDLDFFTEALYKKRTGEYFLFGSGNCGSKYAVWTGNTARGSEVIIPLNYEQAQEWAEQYMDTDEYIKEFGDPEFNADKVQIHINIKKQNAAKIKQVAQKQGMSVSELFDRMIEKI